MYGRKYFGVERSTFLIDREGRIAKIWRKVGARTPRGGSRRGKGALKAGGLQDPQMWGSPDGGLSNPTQEKRPPHWQSFQATGQGPTVGLRKIKSAAGYQSNRASVCSCS